MLLRNLRTALAAVALTSGAACPGGWVTAAFAQQTPAAQQIWTVPEVGALPNNAYGRLVRRGRDLITATYAHIGPEVADRSKRFAGNNLACSNCHLQAGTKKFGIPLFGLFGEFPRYSARSGAQMNPQHEWAGAARQRAGNAGNGGVHQISVDRRGAG